MSDMSAVIIPKSDQLNSDDLLTGPITIKITKVSIRPGTEQPISVFYDGDNGKPWKPCKSMARCLVNAWGPDSAKYVGRSLTLYTDPRVKWGGMEVGGLRISHMSDIDSAITMALTVTRANKKPFTVKPLKPSPPAENAVMGEGKGTAAAQAEAQVASDGQVGASNSALSLPPASAAAPNGFISAEQIGEIESLLEMKGLNKQRFLVVAKVASVDQIKAERFAGAIKWIDAQK